MKISIITALGNQRQIGINNSIPWRISEDFKHFKRTTMGHHMIMGRKTFESIGKPLPGRTTIVLTRDENFNADGVEICSSIQDAIDLAKRANVEELFICGGAAVYESFLPMADELILSEVDYDGEADTFFPDFNLSEWEMVDIQPHPATEKSPYWDLVRLRRREIEDVQ